jgi:hypothetical protein
VDADCCRSVLPNARLELLPLAYFPKNQRVLRHNPQPLAQAVLDSLS